MVRVWGFVIAICALLGFAAWASDFITMQGERTIYTVECRNGTWTPSPGFENRCCMLAFNGSGGCPSANASKASSSGDWSSRGRSIDPK